MSLVVTLNLYDGVIIGSDSASVLPGPPIGFHPPMPEGVIPGAVLKVFDGAERLLPLGRRPIGVATYGTAVIGNRTVSNYLKEFVVKDPGGAIRRETTVKEVAEQIGIFFHNLYEEIVIPATENFRKKPFDQIPEVDRPAFGFIVGGYSANSYLGEVWLVLVPTYREPQVIRTQGDFSINWFGAIEPIDRYIRGYSTSLFNELRENIERSRGSHFSADELAELTAITASHEYVIPTVAMPISVGVEFVKFLIQLVIDRYKFSINDVRSVPVLGPPRIGKTVYGVEGFGIS